MHPQGGKQLLLLARLVAFVCTAPRPRESGETFVLEKVELPNEQIHTLHGRKDPLRSVAAVEQLRAISISIPKNRPAE